MNIVKRTLTSAFMRQNATLFVGTLLVSILNYLYYPVLGRLLETSQFGEVQVLVSFFLQLMMLLMVLTQVTTNIVANYQDETKKQRVIFELEKLAFMVSLGLLAVGSLLSWQLMQALQFQSPIPFVILLLAFTVTIPFTFRSGFLRGQQKFYEVSIGSIIGSASKIVASAALVVIGFGTIGAIGGLVIAQLLALIYTIHRARLGGFKTPADASYFTLPNFKLIMPELKYFGLVLSGSLAITIMYSIDVILVKYYFTPEEAGLYAAVATIARILFFLTVSIAQVLMPAVKLRHTGKTNMKILQKSTLLVGAIGGGALIVITLFPQLTMQILMGEKYLTYAHLLPLLGLAVYILSLLNLFVTYHLALRHYGVGIVTVSGAIITYILMLLFHGSLQQVVSSLFFGSIITLCLLGIWVGSKALKQNNRRREV